MGLQHPSDWILPDTERFSGQARNLTMDGTLIGQYGIRFNDSIEGIKEAIQQYCKKG